MRYSVTFTWEDVDPEQDSQQNVNSLVEWGNSIATMLVPHSEGYEGFSVAVIEE